MLVIGLTGYPKSGKTFIAKKLESLGFMNINLGGITRDEARLRCLSLNRCSTWELYKTLSSRNSQWRIPKVISIIKKSDSDKFVVDGIRSLDEAKEFKRIFKKDFYLVGIKINEKIRLQRIKSEIDENADYKELMKVDKEEKEHIRNIFNLCDCILYFQSNMPY